MGISGKSLGFSKAIPQRCAPIHRRRAYQVIRKRSAPPPMGAQASRLRGGRDGRVLKVEGKMPSLRRGLNAYSYSIILTGY
jgi:hypothetical protein